MDARHIEEISVDPASAAPTKCDIREWPSRYFHDDGSRLTQARGEQQDANRAKDEPDYKDDDRVECARFGCPEHRASEPFRSVRQAVPRRLHRPQGARSKAVSCWSICASWVAARRYRPTRSATRSPRSRGRSIPVIVWIAN